DLHHRHHSVRCGRGRGDPEPVPRPRRHPGGVPHPLRAAVVRGRLGVAGRGLQSVDGEVHEASAIDGANWWPKLLHVVLPYVRGPVLLACLLATLNHINNFTLPFVLFGAPAPDDVNVMPMIVYVTSFQSLRFGLSAAMAIVSLLLIAIPLFAYLRV